MLFRSFDLDGTLFDTTEANVQAYTLAFKAIGLTFDSARYRAFFGLRFAEMMREIAPQLTPQQADEVRRLKSKFYAESLDLAQPNAGLLRLLASVQGQLKTALVTTARRQNTLAILNHFSVSESSFNIIITGEDVDKGKPNPECYLKAAALLNIPAAAALVFEDSDSGVQAAIEAGMSVIRVKI